jgi:hypothetical protein
MLRKTILAAGCVAFLAGQAFADVYIFLDEGAFIDFNMSTGKVMKALETFDYVPVNGVEVMDDPLGPGIPNGPFPLGLQESDNLWIQSNTLGVNAPVPAPAGVGALVAIQGGLFGPNIPNSNVVGANTFVNSTDLLFDPNHTGVGFDMIAPSAGGGGPGTIFHISVFDKNNVEIAREQVAWTNEYKHFFGVWSSDTISRINVAADLGGAGVGELLDNIQMWIPSPGALALLGIAGLFGTRRRRA